MSNVPSSNRHHPKEEEGERGGSRPKLGQLKNTLNHMANAGRKKQTDLEVIDDSREELKSSLMEPSSGRVSQPLAAAPAQQKPDKTKSKFFK